MKYYCYECDEFFEEEDAASRPAMLGDHAIRGTSVMCCPYCGGTDFEEAKKCLRCGEPMKPEESGDFCKDCIEELDEGIESLIESIPGDAVNAKDAFFEYVERRWL